MSTCRFTRSDYDKFPATETQGPIWRGWTEICSEIALRTSGENALLVFDTYHGVYDAELTEAVGKIWPEAEWITTESLFHDEAYLRALTEPYVRLEDGRCLRPVDSYSLGQDTGSLAEQSFYEDLRDQELWDLLYMYTGEEKEGLLYYLVPEDTASLTFCAENRTSQDGQLQSVGEWKLDVEVDAP